MKAIGEQGLLGCSRLIFRVTAVIWFLCFIFASMSILHVWFHPNPGEWWAVNFPFTFLLMLMVYGHLPVISGICVLMECSKGRQTRIIALICFIATSVALIIPLVHPRSTLYILYFVWPLILFLNIWLKRSKRRHQDASESIV